MAKQPSIVVTSTDYQRLNAILDSLPHSDAYDHLIDELERAQIVAPENVPADVVTMRSTVTFTVVSTGRTFTYTLVYPQDMDEAGEKLSILTPVGSALLGLSVGQEIEWPVADDKTTRIRIDSIAYQPEKAGDFRR